MATVVSTVYPPLIETFMPAFPYEGPAEVTFSISPYNTGANIKRIHVSLVNQRTNQSAFVNSQNVVDEWQKAESTLKSTSLYDNIWIVPFPTDSTVGNESYLSYNKSSGTCTLRIPAVLLKNADSFNIGNYYKVQIRFDSTEAEIKGSDYLTKNRQYFSEWSSVCLIRAVPDVSIQMDGFVEEETSSKMRLVQPGLVPLSGRILFSVKDDVTTSQYDETLREFNIKVYNAQNELIASSGTVFTKDNPDPNEFYWLADITNIEGGEILTVEIEILTKNQYSTSKTYQMKVAELDTVTDFEPIWSFKKVKLDAFSDQADSTGVVPSEIVTEEDGIVEFTITTTKDLPKGYLYVKRATSLDNFKTWELMSCTYNTGTVDKTLIDPTVGSLVKYRYSCQYVVERSGSWTSTFFSPEFVYPKFYDILLSRQDKQLAIRYNGQITSYAPVVNRQVINTLGGKYPKFAENARMDYKKFTMTGLITAESDFNRKFINERDYADVMQDYDINMDGKYELRNDTLSDGDLAYKNISRIKYPDTYKRTHALASNTLHDVYPKDNWWLERKFREEALAWLNDGEPKLFRSMTEGNMIVIITDVSLTPNGQLGRRLYNLTCTAYEVGDGYSLDDLAALGIIDVPDEYSDYLGHGSPNDGDDTEDGTIPRELVGQIYSKNAENSNTPTYLISDNISVTEKADIQKYTLKDFYDYLFYQGALKKYKTVPGYWRLQDLRIQFESQPQWYDLYTLDPVTVDKDEEKDFLQENIGLGYKVELTTAPNNNTRNIFVNERGYYQVPSNLAVTQVALFDGAQATLDYKLQYRIAYDESSIPTSAERTDRIVGQVSGKWFPGQDIASEIFNKYEYYKYAEDDRVDNQGYEGILEHQYLRNIGAFGWDGTSYTVFSIQFLDENKGKDYLVGRTGVYNIMKNYSIENVVFKGRRMFKNDNEDYDSYKERTFLLDPSVATWNDSWFDTEADWKEKYKYDEEAPKEEILNVSVVIDGKLNNPIFTKALRKVQEWEDSTNEPYEDIAAVPFPSTNTVYGIRDGNDVVLKLYNFNKVWEDVDFAGFDGHGIVFVEEDTIKTGQKKNFREEWEFDLDESAITGLEQEDLTWYKVFLGKTDIPVMVNESSDIYKYVRDIKQRKFRKHGEIITEVDIENVPVLDGYSSIEAVKNPEYNMIYRFADDSYKIYYIDGGWYNIDFVEGTDNKIILAKVPVNGMVNYRGDIVKIVWG